MCCIPEKGQLNRGGSYSGVFVTEILPYSSTECSRTNCKRKKIDCTGRDRVLSSFVQHTELASSLKACVYFVYVSPDTNCLRSVNFINSNVVNSYYLKDRMILLKVKSF